ncbi:MAG TPA: hypothetical protein VGK27_01950 [Candidatus Deferrimicrobiaceae bacterium]
MIRKFDVTRRAARVAVVTGISTVIAIAIQLVSVPVCMSCWGKEKYGSWLTLLATFTMLRTLETGYVSYVGNRINLAYYRDRDELKRSLASSVAGLCVIGCLQMLLCVVLVLTDWASNAPLILLVPAWIFTGVYPSILHRLMIPAGMMYQAAWWGMGFQVCQFLAVMAAAVANLSLFQATAIYVCVQAIVYLASAAYIRRVLPDYFPWWRGGDPVAGIRDLGRSLGLTGSSLLQQGSANGLVLMVSFLSGPAMVTILTTVRTLTNLWATLTGVLTTPLLPEVVRYHANREGAKVAALQEAHWAIVGTAVNLGILACYPLIAPAYALWTRSRVALDRPLLCFLLSSISIVSAGALMTLYLTGINHIRALLASSFVRGVVSLAAGALLYRRFGFAGLGGAILLAEGIVLAVTYRYFFKAELIDLGVRVRGDALASFSLGVCSVLVFLIAESVGSRLARVTYPLSIAGVVASGWIGWTRLDQDVKRQLYSAISGRFRPGIPS